MIAPARSTQKDCAFAAAKSAINSLSRGFVTGAILPCQDPICDCSVGAAGAVRNRSILPRPEGAAKGCGAAVWSVDLTPARCGAKRLAASLCGALGSGGAVLARTAKEPSQNHQAVEIVGFCLRFSRFYAGASRDVRVGPCVCTCAYTCARDGRTIELFPIVYRLQVVSGSSVVLWRFCAEPAALGLRLIGGIARFSIILAGGYGCVGAARCPEGLRRALLGSEPDESFGDLAGAASIGGRSGADRVRLGGLDQGELGGISARGENGGFLRFLGARQGRVGRPVLERSSQGTVIQRKVGKRPLLVRFVRGHGRGGGSIAQGGTPWPPSRALTSPSRWRCKLAGFGSAFRPGSEASPAPSDLVERRAGEPDGANVGAGVPGRGSIERGNGGRAGRVGVRSGSIMAGKPREVVSASKGVAYVNC